MVEKTLNDLFLAQLKDIYYVEKKIFRTLPKMVKAAHCGIDPRNRSPQARAPLMGQLTSRH